MTCVSSLPAVSRRKTLWSLTETLHFRFGASRRIVFRHGIAARRPALHDRQQRHVRADEGGERLAGLFGQQPEMPDIGMNFPGLSGAHDAVVVPLPFAVYPVERASAAGLVQESQVRLFRAAGRTVRHRGGRERAWPVPAASVAGLTS